MTDTWGRLTDEQRHQLRRRARTLTESELSERFAERDGEVKFRILRRSERSLAGEMDIDRIAREAEEPRESAIALDVGAEFGSLDEPNAAEDFEIAEITLISPEDFDYEPELTEEDEEAARPIVSELAALRPYYAEDRIEAGEERFLESQSEAAGLPPVIDHRPSQSPVKSQGGRGTCVSHAAMGLLEAFAHIPDDLSEQYTHYKFNEFLGRRQDRDQGLRTTDAAPFLARTDGRVCLEAEWPYIPNQTTIDQMVAAETYGPPEGAQKNEAYGYSAYQIITDKGLTGESIKNARYLEALLFQGYDVVIGTWVSWDDKDNNGILDPVLDPNGEPIGQGGHAMVVVGYNRPQQYFIVKNSWSGGWGHNGYGYLHYDLVRSCFKYGFVVKSVVPAAPAVGVPRKLAHAPYQAASISRDDLRGVVLFLRTSKGRYAVTEAYAGDNLYLKNLRVYNLDGSVHLERDHLVIRGTYLCDLDSGRETQEDADFWWRAVRRGVNFLVPRNGAEACIGFDLAHLTKQQIDLTSLSSAAIPNSDLDYAVVVGRTTADRRFKMLVHARPGNQLRISSLELYRPDGTRHRLAWDLAVPSSWTYNLDTAQMGGGRYADIWWHVISDGVGFLERYSYAQTQLVWSL